MHKKTLVLFLFLLFTGCAAGSSESDRTIQAQGQLLIQNQERINDLQAEVDALRGQLEETRYQLNQTIERQKMILQQMVGGSGVSANANTSEDNTSSSTATTPSSDLSGWETSGRDKADYNFIMQFVNDGKKSNEVVAAFQKFIKAYPKSGYLANANYWIGQLYYKQGNKDQASFYYATVVKKFATSSKAADSLYKVGLILLEKGDKKNARIVFQQVISKYSKNKNVVDQAKKKLASLK
ncbi:tol-pal system protein YbgF [Gilliamella sp. Fer1-1]|jgi:tol-pal system protein YbgF|uniref:tol-pal system protein YbgF n=1 Tax=unclassified Gilliamella TaxID=2685620 RepID=UPI00080E9E93|nr:tol-pal system protein YbgF [Gilliamella apicola]OCG16437.1 tol-pal system protein YbgF [Gilliamella apicola]OCG25572.1 tol-pal system protein YbgF [Gilliamella apicola]OCG28763.1 tol-pal system protein YbgF [Gilliamella apicola]OCG34477.1 tol-pal system protein YbgF [Gilliamella apicola]OCG43357.1 tol-pal system protein YbgF [Gilliamella apicola]